MTLHDRIMRARQAQVDHEQKHDVQLAVIPFSDRHEEFCMCDECIAHHGNFTICWATENEVREHWHAEFDDEWREFIHTNYDHEG